LPDGKLIGAGGALDLRPRQASFLLVRFHPDGTIDDTFGQQGIVKTVVGPYGGSAADLVVQADGKLVVAGASGRPDSGRPQFALARYDSDGALDVTFGTDGIVTT